MEYTTTQGIQGRRDHLFMLGKMLPRLQEEHEGILGSEWRIPIVQGYPDLIFKLTDDN